MRTRHVVLTLTALATGWLLTGCTGSSAPDDTTAGTATASPGAVVGDAAVGPSPTPTYPMCAELTGVTVDDPREPAGGWWSDAPADAEANVIQDPTDWPDPRLREHPRTALVEASTGEVIATYDRVACGPIPDLVLTDDSTWPASGVVVVDAGTGELLQEMDPYGD